MYDYDKDFNPFVVPNGVRNDPRGKTYKITVIFHPYAFDTKNEMIIELNVLSTSVNGQHDQFWEFAMPDGTVMTIKADLIAAVGTSENLKGLVEMLRKANKRYILDEDEQDFKSTFPPNDIA